MQLEGIRARRRKRIHRFGFLFLVGLLVAFAAWSVWLLIRAERLRDELDLYFGWTVQIRAVRQELAALGAPDAASSPLDPPEGTVPPPGRDTAGLEAFRRDSEELLGLSADPALGVAVQRLRRALDKVAPPLEWDIPEPPPEEDSDVVWQTANAALYAADELESELRGRVARLHQRLDEHWSALYKLVVAALLLAASNLFLLQRVHRRRNELEAAHAQALRNARHDPLTGLWNREGILRLLSHELVRAARSQAPVGVILVDLDNFKEINDLLGQDQGDYILKQVGQRLHSLVRPYDTMGRYGGDSFLIVLPACDRTATNIVGQRLRESINERDVEHAFGHIRVSINLAQMTIEGPAEIDVDTLLRRLHDMIRADRVSPP